ncbi:MAG: 1,6-anhydro-N-acetylmuramyl-L-alanine amidase AmpD [Burkholderiaceae bacterium]
MTGAAPAYAFSHGWVSGPGVHHIPSPNADARPVDTAIDLLVIHNISLPPGQFMTGAVARLFTNMLDTAQHPYYAGLLGLRVSAHFLIDRLGGLTQFVSTDQRAWHAGASVLEVDGTRRERCNDFSIGIELEGCDDLAYSACQYRALAALTLTLAQHYPIAHLRGHSEIAPGRKSDPGPAFDWSKYLALTGFSGCMRPCA